MNDRHLAFRYRARTFDFSIDIENMFPQQRACSVAFYNASINAVRCSERIPNLPSQLSNTD
jgi:hypothetical protein